MARLGYTYNGTNNNTTEKGGGSPPPPPPLQGALPAEHASGRLWAGRCVLFDGLCVCLVAWVGRSKPPVCAIHSSIHPNQSHIQPTSTTHSADLTDAASLDAVIGAFRPTVLVHAAGGLGCGLCVYVCVYCVFLCVTPDIV